MKIGILEIKRQNVDPPRMLGWANDWYFWLVHVCGWMVKVSKGPYPERPVWFYITHPTTWRYLL